MEKWDIDGRRYFAAPIDTPEIRQWLADLPIAPAIVLINALYSEAIQLGAGSHITKDNIEYRLSDWKRARVVEELERRIYRVKA